MSYGTVQAEKMTTESGYSLGAGNASSFKNRIINGEMDIDQRNAGASVTPINTGYTLDRWFAYQAQTASRFSVQQNAGNVTRPAGFTNYLGVTSLSAYSLASNDVYTIGQAIEGFNVADLGWGTSNAKPVTLSFWVRSSLTGTFGGVIRSRGDSNSYPFTYTISAANTWEQESITITGPTSGTFPTNNAASFEVLFGLGVGSTFSGTAGAWSSASTIYGATGGTSVVSTNGATFYITGVQLEVGTVATSFDFRSYGTELQLCMRYFQLMNSGGAVGTAENASRAALGYGFPVPMRAAATGTLSSPVVGFLNQPQGGPNAVTNMNNFFYGNGSGTTDTGGWLIIDTATANWTTGRVILNSGTKGMIQFSAEL